MSCTVYYQLNEIGRKKSLLSGGDGKEWQQIEAPITDELMSLDNVNIDSDGNVKLYIGRANGYQYGLCKAILKKDKTKKVTLDGITYYKPYIDYEKMNTAFDYIPTLDDLISCEQRRLRNLKISYDNIKDEYEMLLDEYESKYKEQQSIEAEKKEQEKLKREEERRKAEEEKENWILSYGSERLKLCLKLGYECKRLYMNERVQRDFPDYELDFDDNASWNTRVSPTLDALLESKNWIDSGFESKIVWLTNSVHGSEYDYENGFEECEAVVVKFQGYDLVKVIY